MKRFFPRSRFSRIFPLFGSSFTAGADAQVPKLCALLARSQTGSSAAAPLPSPAHGTPFPVLSCGISSIAVLGWGAPFSTWSVQSLEAECCFLLSWVETRQIFPEAARAIPCCCQAVLPAASGRFELAVAISALLAAPREVVSHC